MFYLQAIPANYEISIVVIAAHYSNAPMPFAKDTGYPLHPAGQCTNPIA
jgi:hypothetical protein